MDGRLSLPARGGNSLRDLCDLCVSAVYRIVHRRGAEVAEATQRILVKNELTCPLARETTRY